MTTEIVRYRPGAPIDTTKILEIKGLANAQWGPIEEAYPEVKTAGPTASFRSAANVTIFPPNFVPPKLLRVVLGVADREHVVYPHVGEGDAITAVLVHVRGGYASIHIYRLTPPRKRNSRR